MVTSVQPKGAAGLALKKEKKGPQKRKGSDFTTIE
jgi:hypothetical protein